MPATTKTPTIVRSTRMIRPSLCSTPLLTIGTANATRVERPLKQATRVGSRARRERVTILSPRPVRSDANPFNVESGLSRPPQQDETVESVVSGDLPRHDQQDLTDDHEGIQADGSRHEIVPTHERSGKRRR